MMRSTNQFVTFVTALLVCLFLSGIIWQEYLPGRIYNCTDDNLIGFLTPAVGFTVITSLSQKSILTIR